MTVAAQVKQTLAGLKGVQSTLHSFTVIENNGENKQLLTDSAERIQQVIERLEKRVGELELSEPQYRGF